MNPRPDSVMAADDYTLWVKFENGEEKIFDMKPFLHYPVYEELKNELLFKDAKVQYGTVVWNEEIDLDPDTLYLESKK
jgi:hypothetical protein